MKGTQFLGVATATVRRNQPAFNAVPGIQKVEDRHIFNIAGDDRTSWIALDWEWSRNRPTAAFGTRPASFITPFESISAEDRIASERNADTLVALFKRANPPIETSESQQRLAIVLTYAEDLPRALEMLSLSQPLIWSPDNQRLIITEARQVEEERKEARANTARQKFNIRESELREILNDVCPDVGDTILHLIKMRLGINPPVMDMRGKRNIPPPKSPFDLS